MNEQVITRGLYGRVSGNAGVPHMGRAVGYPFFGPGTTSTHFVEPTYPRHGFSGNIQHVPRRNLEEMPFSVRTESIVNTVVMFSFHEFRCIICRLETMFNTEQD